MTETAKDKLISRLHVAEHALSLIASDELPQVKQFLSTSCCELNVISDSKAFWSNEHADERLNRERAASKRMAIIHPSPDCLSHFHVFTEPEVTEKQLVQFAEYMKSFMAVTYAAIGLDMTTLGELTPAGNIREG